MNFNLKRLPLADLRLKITTEMRADPEAQFQQRFELHERMREAEPSRARKPALIEVSDPERLPLNLF